MASDQREGRPAGTRDEGEGLDQAGLTPDYLSTALRRAERQGDEETRRLLNGIASQHQREIHHLQRELEAATDGEIKARQAETDAVQAMQLKDKAAKAKSIFLANVSHELRTPLNGMIGMSELLKQTEMTPKQSDYVDSIRVCGDTLLQVINDILDFSKMEAGKLRMFNVAFSLREAVPEVIRAVRCSQPPDGQVKTVEKLDLPAQMVYGDNVRLHQIFMNLLSNSYKFTQQGQVTIHGRTDYEDETSITVTCSVEDTGIGITDEQMKRLFRPFSQADDSTGRRYGGSGLGLSICKSLIEMMGGRVWISSHEGQGTTVSFSLTYPKATPNMAATVSDVSTPTTEPLNAFPGALNFEHFEPDSPIKDPVVDLSHIPRSQIRICVAEDNLINQKIAVTFVEKLGLKVDAFDDGQKTVDSLRIKAQEGSPYHIVLMDVQMPILDGYRATEIIRQDPNPVIREVLIIAMTASAIEGDREKCLAAGMNDYLAKPVRHAALSAKLSKYLSPVSPTTSTGKSRNPVSPSVSTSDSTLMPPPATQKPSRSSPSSPTIPSSRQIVTSENTNLRSQARPRANRASTGSPLAASQRISLSQGGLGAENPIVGGHEARPRPVPRRTASGRVETLKSMSLKDRSG